MGRGCRPGEDAAQERSQAPRGGPAGEAAETAELGRGRVEHGGEGRGLPTWRLRVVDAGDQGVEAGLGRAAAASAERGAAVQPGEQGIGGVGAMEVGDEREDGDKFLGDGLTRALRAGPGGGRSGGAAGGGGSGGAAGGGRSGGAAGGGRSAGAAGGGRSAGVEGVPEGVEAGGAGGEPLLVQRAEATKVAWRGADEGEPVRGGEGPEVALGAGHPGGSQVFGLGGAAKAGAQGREGWQASGRERWQASSLAGGEQGEGVLDLDPGEQHGALGGVDDGPVESGEAAEATLQLLDGIVRLGHGGMIRRRRSARGAGRVVQSGAAAQRGGR